MSSDDGSIQLCLSLYYTPLPHFSLLQRTPAIDNCDINGNNMIMYAVYCLSYVYLCPYSFF